MTIYVTAAMLANYANASIAYYLKGPAMAQTLQDRPFMKAMKSAQKTFPSGKEIKGNVKGDYTSEFMGYSYADKVTYKNPANIKQFTYDWTELHVGISVTHTELKQEGISVVESNGAELRRHSNRELTVITNIFDDKLDDMAEGSARSWNEMALRDGTQGAKIFAGLEHFVADDPTVGVTGGIDRATNVWWRNRALVGSNKITHSTSLQTLTKTLRSEVRQLRRYGGRPTIAIAGSGFIEKLEAEIHEKGAYTDSGFASNKATDITMADISMRGVGKIVYDPSLDDLGRTNFLYLVDPRHLYPMVMDGEDMTMHSPERPPEQYVLYRAITWTGTMMARRLNCHGVYEAA